MVYESHHFYPSVLYFRFKKPQYATARGALIVMETVSIIQAALEDQRYAHFKKCGGVEQLWNCTMNLLTDFAQPYLPHGKPNMEALVDPEVLKIWERRFHRAYYQLRLADIEVTPNLSSATQKYVIARRKWNAYLMAFGNYMVHDWTDIAPADFI